MTAPVILVDASPRRASDGAVQTVRLAGGGALYPYRYGAADYRAGIVQLPEFIASLPFEGGDFGAGAVPQAAELQWAPSTKADLAAMANHFWIDAPITVRIGDENAAGTLPPVVLTGKVLAATVDGGVLKIALCDPAADLKKPLLTARYGGTGNLDGPPEWDGKIKRRLWGRVWNIAGELIDAANNIYCWADPARPLQGFDAVRDKGAPAAALTTVAWQGSQAATLAALRAAVAPQGGGVICPSIACVKWWTQPAGELTADLRGEIGTGYVERTAQIVERIVQAGPNTPFAAGTVAAASALRTAPVGWVAKDETTTVAAMIEELLGHSSLLWLLDSAGAIVIREWAWGASAASAISQSVKRTDVLRPVGTRKIGYARNETPTARGNLAAIVLASDAAYLDGTPLEALKPAAAGADVTAANTAAAIAGQGDLATSNRATLPFGTNLAVNSEFLLVDPTYGGGVIPVGWQAGWTGDSTNVGTLTFNTRRVQFQDGSFAFARDVTGAPNGTAMDCVSSYPVGLPLGRFAVPVLPGERIVASALIGHQNCAGAYAVIGLYDENGAYVDEYAGATITRNIGAAAYNTLTRNSLGLVTAAVTVPADGSGGGTGRRRWAVIGLRFSISGSPANPRLVVAAPMLAKVPASQTAIPAYNPGPADRQASFGATTGANLVSPTYGTLSDSGVYTPIGTAAAIAGQAATATNSDYGAVTGTKPPSNATRNDDTANMLEAPLLMDSGFEVNPTAAREFTNTAAGPGRDRYRIRLDSNNALYAIQWRMIPVSAGETLWMRAWFFAGLGTTGTSQFGVECFNTSFGYVTAVGGPQNPASAGAGWFLREAPITIPAGVSFIRPYFQRYGGSGGNYFLAEPAITRHQLGADITGTNTAAAIAGQAATATNSNYTAITGTKPPADADKTSLNTAAAIAGQAATATNSDYDAVTGTKPPSNATNGAPTGTPVGAITAGDVSSTIQSGGGVAANQVATAAIVANGVTVPASAFSSGFAICLGATETTVQTLTLLTSGAPVALLFSVQQSPTGSSPDTGTVRVYRGSTLLYEADSAVSSTSGVRPITTSMVSDAPAAGTHTYTIRIFLSGLSMQARAVNRSILAIETKR